MILKRCFSVLYVGLLTVMLIAGCKQKGGISDNIQQDNASLSELKLNAKQLSLTETEISENVKTLSSVNLYAAAVSKKAKITVTLTKAGESNSAEVNGNKGLYKLQLNPGENKAVIDVKAGNAKHRVTVKITREKSSDSSLAEFKLNGEDLPLTDSQINRQIEAEKNPSKLKVVPAFGRAAVEVKLQKAGEGASLPVAGSGGEYSLELKKGLNKVFVSVKSEDGLTKKDVTLNLEMLKSADVSLAELKLDEKELEKDKDDLHETVENMKTSGVLTVRPADSSASVEVSFKKANDVSVSPISPSGNNYNLAFDEGVNTALITVTAENGSTKRTITLGIRREKHKPNSNEVRVVINLVSFVAGSNVEGSTVKAYKTGENTEIASEITDENGNAYFNLEKNTGYDFIAVGIPSKRAESRLEGFYVEDKGRTFALIQRPAQPGELTKAPRIKELRYAKEDIGNILNIGNEITDGQEFNGQTIQTEKGGLHLTFESFSRPIRYIGTEGGFDVAINIGSPVTSVTNISKVYTADRKTENNGIWTCTYYAPLSNVWFPDGMETLYIAAYDEAGNRIERHVKLNFKPKNPGSNTAGSLTGASIDNIRAEIIKYSKPAYLYSLPSNGENSFLPAGINPHDGFECSYKAEVYFKAKKAGQEVPIRGYKLYRREKGSSEWLLALQKAYNVPSAGNVSADPNYNLYHEAVDADSLLSDGKTYEYKIKAYGDGSGNEIESGVITVSLMPSFNLHLTFPYKADTVKADEVEFKFKVSNPALLDKDVSDVFQFGILVCSKLNIGQIPYAAKLKYCFDKQGDDRLYIAYNASDYKSLSDWKKNISGLKDVSVENLISYDMTTGEVTVKKAFLDIADFNIGGVAKTAFNSSVERGVSYFWDVLDWGNEPGKVGDDSPAMFNKSGVYGFTSSHSNFIGSGGAVNGFGTFNIE